jgi:hypothetical protein
MTFGPRSLLIAAAVLLAVEVLATSAQAQDTGTWNGTWAGLMNNKAPIAISIAGDKVVSYAIEGAPFAIQYSKVTAADVSFGDRTHYAVKLTRTSDTTAAEVAHGRLGYGRAALTKQ